MTIKSNQFKSLFPQKVTKASDNDVLNLKMSRTLAHFLHSITVVIFTISFFQIHPAMMTINNVGPYIVLFGGLLVVFLFASLIVALRTADESFMHEQSDTCKISLKEKYDEIYGSKSMIAKERYLAVENGLLGSMTLIIGFLYFGTSIIYALDNKNLWKIILFIIFNTLISIAHLAKLIMSALIVNEKVPAQTIALTNFLQSADESIATSADVLTCLGGVCFITGYLSMDPILWISQIYEADLSYSIIFAASFFQTGGSFYFLSVVFRILEHCCDFYV